MKKIVLILVLLCVAAYTFIPSVAVTDVHDVLRLHILAPGDSADEQALKLCVRDSVSQYLTPVVSRASSLEEAMYLVGAELDAIEDVARERVKQEGADVDVRVSLERCDFPDREYNGVVYPAGEYEALRIELGEAQGQNWWCVIFPPLCFGTPSPALRIKSFFKELFSW